MSFVYRTFIKLGISKNTADSKHAGILLIIVCLVSTIAVILWNGIFIQVFARDTVPDGVSFLKNMQ